MMVDYQDFNRFVDDLRNIYSNENLIEYDLHQKYSNKLNSVIEEINILYRKESEYTYEKYIMPFIDKYSFLQTPSILSAINKLQYETFHSLILKKLWNPQNGQQLLSNFISTIDDIPLNEKIKIQEYILQGNYSIKEEHTIRENKKRIDLLITENSKKWLIIIENKINATISVSKNKTQLQYYYQYGETKLKEYTDRYYILLSHRDNQKDIIAPWIYATYNNVFLSLIKTIPEKRITQDYLASLFSLLYPNNISQDDIGNSLYMSYQFYYETIKHIK